MLMESWGKLEKSQGNVREFSVKNLADTLRTHLESKGMCQAIGKKSDLVSG